MDDERHLDEDRQNQNRHSLCLRNLGVRRRCGWQREGDDVVATWRAERAVAAGTDDEILTLVATHPVGHGRGLTAGGQLVLPQLASGLDVEGTKAATQGRGGTR